MFFRNCLNKVAKLDSLKEWQEKNKNHFLLGFFCMANSNEEFNNLDNWSIDFYDMDRNLVSTFKDEEFEESEILDKETVVTPLELEGFDILEPLDLLEKCNIKKFNKVIAVLRQRDDKITFSVKFMIVPLKLILMELDAVSGEILSTDEQSLMDLAKKG